MEPNDTKQDPGDVIRMIIEQYDQPRLVVSEAFGDGGIDPLWPRFLRAATNQAENGEATVSRYAIWANTVRDNIVSALRYCEIGREEDAKQLLIRAANSLSAFSDLQAYFDPFEPRKRPQR